MSFYHSAGVLTPSIPVYYRPVLIFSPFAGTNITLTIANNIYNTYTVRFLSARLLWMLNAFLHFSTTTHRVWWLTWTDYSSWPYGLYGIMVHSVRYYKHNATAPLHLTVTCCPRIFLDVKRAICFCSSSSEKKQTIVWNLKCIFKVFSSSYFSFLLFYIEWEGLFGVSLEKNYYQNH